MAITYDAIATATLSSPNTITFTNIPNTYTDLIVVGRVAAVTSGADIRFRFNDDSGSNYNYTGASSNGSSPQSYRNTSQTAALMDYNAYPSTTVGEHVGVLQIYSYAGNKYKTCIARSSVAKSGYGVDLIVSQWRSTSAITSITLGIGTGFTNFATGSVMTLFGIKAA